MSQSIETLFHVINPPGMFYYLLSICYPAFLTEHTLFIPVVDTELREGATNSPKT